MPANMISLDEAIELTRTGDLWLFRGRKAADRAIQLGTNSPVNHVGMTVAVEDLPPLMWHAELGRSLPDMWSGGRHRGVQLHDLRAAVVQWADRYGQRVWLRQLEHPVTRAAEDALLRTIARLDGTPFPSTAGLAARWLRGRLPAIPRRWLGQGGTEHEGRGEHEGSGEREGGGAGNGGGAAGEPTQSPLETAYCAEVVAMTYQAMGLLPADRRPSWYDPGRFWSGDHLGLSGGARLSGEIAIGLPPAAAAPPAGAVR